MIFYSFVSLKKVQTVWGPGTCQKGHCDKKKSFIGEIFDVLFVCDANNEAET